MPAVLNQSLCQYPACIPPNRDQHAPCWDVCPSEGAITVEPGSPVGDPTYPVIHEDLCLECGACVNECPFHALSMTP